MSRFKEVVDSDRLYRHDYCIADEMVEAGYPNFQLCGSSDALSFYQNTYEDGSEDFSAYCFSCAQGFRQEHLAKSSHASELGLDPEDGSIKERKTFQKKPKQPRITREQQKELWLRTDNDLKGYRGLSNTSIEFYGFRVEHKKDGSVKAIYFPETKDGKLQGYKSRHHPKGFGWDNIGITGGCNDLCGQVRFPDGGRYCLIVGGELDVIAAQDMLHEYQTMKNQDDYNRYAVVSPTTGESSSVKQCRAQYEWFDKFDTIIIGLDADEVGKEATLSLAEVLPKEKVRIATWTGGKDPNEMLQKGKNRQFLSDFFGAKELISSGITSSVNLMESIKEALKRPRIPLPKEMSKLQDMTKGDGLICNRIYNLIGDTSVGKSTFINIISHHLFFSEGIKAGIVSLEASDGEYGADLLSYHLSQNLYWLEEDEALAYLDDPEVSAKAREMLVDEFGESRFHVLDDRSGTWDGLKRRIEQLHRQFGCNVIIIDVLTDLLRTMSNEEQSAALNWMSNFVKNGVTIINVLHTRKPAANRGGIPQKPTEWDILGSSIFSQKAAGNIVIYRNKTCTTDPIEQNTTYWDVPKMRQGKTGDKIMAMYYDGETRQVYDRDRYFSENPDKLPTGYDLSVSSFDQAYYEEGGRGWNGISKQGFSRKQSKPKQDEPDIMDDVPL